MSLGATKVGGSRPKERLARVRHTTRRRRRRRQLARSRAGTSLNCLSTAETAKSGSGTPTGATRGARRGREDLQPVRPSVERPGRCFAALSVHMPCLPQHQQRQQTSETKNAPERKHGQYLTRQRRSRLRCRGLVAEGGKEGFTELEGEATTAGRTANGAPAVRQHRGTEGVVSRVDRRRAIG
jgi:hypothetical protein